MDDFDISFDYKIDKPRKTKPDADRDSQQLRSDHELLWTKKLPSGELFAPKKTSRRDRYLIFTDTFTGTEEVQHCYGSDTITTSYSKWLRPKSFLESIASLNKKQQARFLDPPYTIGSAMIWPVRSKDRPTINQARGLRLKVADRIDLTLECIRRHYASGPESPLTDVLNAYEDFFLLFTDFKRFVDFFHFQDLVTHDYDAVNFFLLFENFERSGIPISKLEYVTYREATLDLIAKRGERMAKWVEVNHPEIEVRR